MNQKYREIESKRRLDNITPELARDILLSYFQDLEPGGILDCQTIDDYWLSPGSSQFVRLRNSWGKRGNGTRKELKEITTKKKDKGSNIDRMEVNVAVESILDTRKMLSLVLGGAPLGKIRKKETVLFLLDAVVSLSTINDTDTFLEIEAEDLNTINNYFEEIGKVMPLSAIEPRSLFEIYVLGER